MRGLHLGQEIYTFFNIYGTKGLFGLFISIGLIAIIIYKTFNVIIENKIENYQEFITNVVPDRFKNNNILKFTINNIINIFLLISFNIMVAGFATYFWQELNISKWCGAIIIAILSFVTFSKNIDGIVKINTYLIPTLILLILFLGFKKITNISIIKMQENQNTLYWIISSVLYASYNSITLVPILITLKKYIKTNKEAKVTSILTAVIMIVLSVCIFLLMNLFINKIAKIEIPIVYIASTMGMTFKYIYGITVLIAIFTTAISAGYGFLSNATRNKKSYIVLSILICICSVFIGQIGFSNLINLLYPIFGYLGIIQIIFLLKT